MKGREAAVSIPGFIPEEDDVRLDRQHFLHEALHAVNVTIKSAVSKQKHSHPIESSFGLQVEKRFLDRAQWHCAIHRILRQRISFDIERLSAAKDKTVVMRLMAVAIDQNDVAGANQRLHRDLIGSRSAIRAKEELLTTKSSRRFVLGDLDVPSRLEKRIQAARRGGGFREEHIGAVKVAEVADPMGIEDRLTTRNRQGVEGADRTPRIFFQVVEVRRLVALVNTFQDRQVDLHQIFDPVENAADVFRIEMARHLLRSAIHNQIDIQLGADLSDRACQRDSIVLRFKRAALLREMLLEVAAQQWGVELRLEAKVIFYNYRLHVGIHYDRSDSFFEARHSYRLIDERIFRTAQLPKLSPALSYLFRRWIIANDQDFEIRFGE